MINHPSGTIEYDATGEGPTVVLVPGSCSTGAAWRSLTAAWAGRFRCVTTSLLGYGRTAERRRSDDCAIAHEAAALEAVIEEAATPVHLVGHSFGGLVALAVALRAKARLYSLTVLEAPAIEILRHRRDDHHHYRDVRTMADRYLSDFLAGDLAAIRHMVDFYGGPGTFAAWPSRVRAYAMETTEVNIRDWASAFGFLLLPKELETVSLPCLVAWGEKSHPAIQRANRQLGAVLRAASSIEIEGASHFMIATHPAETANLIARHVERSIAQLGTHRPLIEEPRPGVRPHL